MTSRTARIIAKVGIAIVLVGVFTFGLDWAIECGHEPGRIAEICIGIANLGGVVCLFGTLGCVMTMGEP